MQAREDTSRVSAADAVPQPRQTPTERSVASPPEAVVPSRVAVSQRVMPAEPRAAETSSDSAALPPAGTPLVDMLADLETRAAHGDRRASCRLGLEGERCLRVRALDATANLLGRSAGRSTSTDGATARLIADLDAAATSTVAGCAGLPDGWADTHVWRHLLAAAPLDPRLAVHFATRPPLDSSLADLQEDAWAAYRAAAPDLLLGAARAGDPHALYILQRIHSGVPLPHLPDGIAPDSELAMVYALVLERFADAATRAELRLQIDAGRSVFDADAWRSIQAQADAWTARHFRTQSTVDFTPEARGDGMLDVPDPAICEADGSADVPAE